MKGRSVQYHSNISKDEGRVFYETFTNLCEVFYFYFLILVRQGIKITASIFLEHITACVS